MNEQILAYGGQRRYAQGEGRFIMPGSEPGEGLRPNVGHKQAARQEPHKEAPGLVENQDPKPKEPLFKPLNRPENDRPLIPFKDAWLAVEVISQIQDGRDVTISGSEFRKIRELNERFGDEDEAKRLEKPEEAICYAQEVLRNSRVEDPVTEDFDYEKGSPHVEKSHQGEEDLAINVARLKVARVQEAGGASIESEKAAAHLTIEEDMEPFPETSGPGASAGGTPDWYDHLPDPATVSDAALARTIRGIQRIGASKEDELSRLKRMQEKLDDIAAETPEAKSAERILNNRIRELKDEATAMRADEIKKSRETPPAEDMLEITMDLKRRIKDLMERDKTDPEWAVNQALLQVFLTKAEEIVHRVVDLEETDAHKMKTGDVVDKYADGQDIRTYRYVFEVTRALDESSKEYTSASEQAKLADIAGSKDRLDAYAARKRSQRLIHRLDRHFLINFEDKTRAQQDEVVGDIDEKAHHYYHAALSGWRDLDEATRIVLELADRKDKDDKDGFREWKATNGFQSIIDAVKIYQMTAEPHDWRDVPKVLSNIFNEIEDTQVSPDDLGAVAQKARQIIARIPQGEGGRELRIRLSDRLEAFKAWHVMIMNLDKKDMNPEAAISGFQEYFEGREETTMENFLNRFGADNRGREFYVTHDEDGKKEFLDKDGKKAPERINVFDVEHALIDEAIHSERIKSNIIEAMTMHAIEKKFDSRTLREIQIWAGLRNADGSFNEFFDWMERRTPAEAEAFFNAEVEKLRLYFIDKVDAKTKDPKYTELAGMRVDDIWARKTAFQINGKDTSGVDITQDLVGVWHKQRTLHGAFGTIGREDLKELANEFDLDFNADEDSKEWKALRDKFLGESFLKVRRDAIKDLMIAQLRRQGLQVNRKFTEDQGIDLKDADFDELDESGFFGSVEYNTYQWVWIHQWGNLDTIRIYSRDSKSKLDDDYEKVVFHRSSNMFMDRMISHGWEFFHDGNETRGRPKENDVNRIAKQYLPGKHHYLFPQNTAAVRWAEKFMTGPQIKWVEERVRHLMTVYDSDVPAWHTDAVDWMRKVVIMDMIENGQFKFTQIDPKTGRRIKFTDKIKEKNIGKFEMIDLFSDRAKHVKYLGPEGFQDYLANPSNQKFAELADKTKFYYSTRDARLFSFMVFALRWHWELMNKHNQRLFDRINLQSAGMDNFVEGLASAGVVEKETAVDFKRLNLGFMHYSPKGNQNELKGGRPEAAAVLLGSTFPRRVRQALELMRLSGWENKWSVGGSLSALWAMVLEYFKRLPSQLGQR